MNAYAHSLLSVKRRGGAIEDYYAIHDFMDSTKEICSDNRHRLFHTLWGVRRVVVPIFGAAIVNSDGRKVSVKDLCEQDHIMPDYGNKFIPTLEDFAAAMTDLSEQEAQLIDDMHADNALTKEVSELPLSPLSITGKLSSLLITHNSWFLTVVLPRLFECPLVLRDFPVAPGRLFQKLAFEPWMDNGRELPPSRIRPDLTRSENRL